MLAKELALIHLRSKLPTIAELLSFKYEPVCFGLFLLSLVGTGITYIKESFQKGYTS